MRAGRFRMAKMARCSAIANAHFRQGRAVSITSTQFLPPERVTEGHAESYAAAGNQPNLKPVFILEITTQRFIKSCDESFRPAELDFFLTRGGT